MKATDAKIVGAKQKVKSSVTEVAGATHNFMWDNYNPIIDIWETDPNTGSAWTYAAINAAQFGIEVA